MGRLILNCDLGENEPLELTEKILSLVDAASIGCGFHAGGPEKTRATIKLALKHQVKIGAHPGIPEAGGRGGQVPDAHSFRELLEIQIGAFQAATRSLGVSADYIKLHGSLYHAVETQAILAEVFIDFVDRHLPDSAVFALAGAGFARTAESAGLRVYHEAFADRDYLGDGSLVPRSEAGAVLTTEEALTRLRAWIGTGKMPSRSGQNIVLEADTLCVHGDSPEAIEMIRRIRPLVD